MLCTAFKLCVIAGLLVDATLADCKTEGNKVKFSGGCLEGRQHKEYVSFEGIRYAEPPLGENRFEPAKPYTETWEGVRSATALGPMCLQRNVFNDFKMEGDEDCLFLNVYKPVRDSSEEETYPVLVHIHGGGFMFGDGGFYGPEYLMGEGKFVYVSFNYRLGPLGFLSTNCHLVPGNMGFKDQVLALKWVKDNIASFGGDPNNVLLTGFSAGGASVHLHYMSPLSDGLFHRGVSHSGCALNEWVVMKDPLKNTLTLAEEVGCNQESHKEMVKCLKSKDAKELIAQTTMFSATKEYEHEGAFITDFPVNYLKEGKIQKLPWLASATVDDFALMMARYLSNATYWDVLNDNPKKLLQLVSPEEDISEEVADKLKQHYFKGEPLTQKNAVALLGKLLNDRGFFYGITESILLQEKLAPVYFYLYKMKLSRGLGVLMNSNDDLGVVHGDDVLLMYKTPAHSGDFKFTKAEKDMSEELLEMYEAFSKEGVPKFDDTLLTKAVDGLQYTTISQDAAQVDQTAPFCDMEFWRAIKKDMNEV